MRRRFAIGAVAVAVTLAAATGCSFTPSAQDKENAGQQAATGDIIAAQPVPAFPYSLYRQNLMEIEKAQAIGAGQTTTFMFQQGSPAPIRQCASIGYPIPANASISNPQQVVNASNNGSWTNQVLEQMDPNGIYQSPSTSGTYVMCVGPDGQARATYWEGFVETESGGAQWNGTAVVPIGAPSSHFSTKCTMQGNVPVCN
jgi:hypothetical protein